MAGRCYGRGHKKSGLMIAKATLLSLKGSKRHEPHFRCLDWWELQGQGVATPGDIFDNICPLRTSRQRAYNTVPVDNSWRVHVPNPLSDG